MTRPNLPTYTSPENNFFHPVFKRAVEELLESKGLSNSIAIQGQYPSPTGPVDFVLVDRTTHKIILPIEIKRTPSGVRGLGRRQARDYWQNLGTKCQTLFYCVSNLEVTELFRHDSTRPRTSAQRVNLENGSAGKLGITPKDELYEHLIACIDEILDIIQGRKSYVYSAGLSQLQAHIESTIGNNNLWHQAFIPACFEYIRGAAHQNTNLRDLTQGWREASFYSNTPARLNQLGSRVDFEHIFCEPKPDPNDPYAFIASVLREAYESGKMLSNGDDIAELVNEILAPSGMGIVETDTELAQLIGVVSRAVLGRELSPTEEVLDPGCGSGRLLTALPISAFPSITPKQIVANEIEPRFAESLSLRLGLAFADTISPDNAPKVTISDIAEVEKESLTNIKLVVMNPPFLSGIRATSIKQKFSNRIHQVSGQHSTLNNGQIALEALFLELVWNLVSDGTVIATIFPIQHLYRDSAEVIELRRFLIEKFALSHIVIYPSKGIFENVAKQTVLLIGQKGIINHNVKIVEVQRQLGDIDFGHLSTHLDTAADDQGIKITSLLREALITSVESGWKEVIGTGPRVRDFLESYMAQYKSFKDLPVTTRRGTVGNGGNTALVAFNKDDPRYPNVVNLIPSSWLKGVLVNANNLPRNLAPSSAPETTFLPPNEAYVDGTPENVILNRIIGQYRNDHVPSRGAQAGLVHDSDTIRQKLKADQKDLGAGWVLIPRGSRAKGEIGLYEQGVVLISSNIGMVKLPTAPERKLVASWLLSIFGQLQLEQYGNPQEGMRKLEMSNIKKVCYPDLSQIPAAVQERIIARYDVEQPISFSDISIREIDLLWAEVVAPSNAAECLRKALGLLQDICDERTGFGNA